MKKLLEIVTPVFLMFGVCLAAAFAENEPQGPIKVTNFGKMPPVTFKHSTHKKNLQCKTCHHKKESKDFKCGTAACHQVEQRGKAIKIKDAAHEAKVGRCWSCHFKASSTVTKPMKCKECHSEK